MQIHVTLEIETQDYDDAELPEVLRAVIDTVKDAQHPKHECYNRFRRVRVVSGYDIGSLIAVSDSVV